MEVLSVPSKLKGKTVSFAGSVTSELFVIITTDKQVFVLQNEYDECNEEIEMRVCGKGRVARLLSEHVTLAEIFKKYGVLDWAKYIREMDRKQAENEARRAAQQLEHDRALYMKLKAQFEPK